MHHTDSDQQDYQLEQRKIFLNTNNMNKDHPDQKGRTERGRDEAHHQVSSLAVAPRIVATTSQ